MGDLEKRIQRLEDIEAVRRLQNVYGYYLDKCLYEEVV
ncbi:MAG: nuclear transport factor 2 family protein, partial [Armatimonadota bacterium]|nr:nuclear transport factor 2 family protein [Armatimonadota bacterium]